MNSKLKIGVFGGRRGAALASALNGSADAKIEAVCEGDPARAAAFRERFGREIAVYSDPERFLAHDFDGAILANYATEHAPYATRLLDSGRHVCSEVVAFSTLAEAVELVEAVERNPSRVYAYAENYCYMRGVQEMRKVYRSGAIGELLHCEGEYVHDCESIWSDITSGGNPKHWRMWTPSTFYCTHSLGPLLYMTGRRPERLSAYESPNINKRKLGSSSGDGSMIAMSLEGGATAKILPWCNYKRNPEAVWFCLYGSEGMMETDRWGDTYNKMNIYYAKSGKHEAFKPGLPCDSLPGGEGHGGGDFFAVQLFIDAILRRERFPGMKAIDVYEAADMTLPGILGSRSILCGNAAMDIPDLRNKAARIRLKGDHWAQGQAGQKGG